MKRKPLVVWTVCDGEPMSIDEGSPRLLRMSLLSQELADRGHKIVYWTSRFDHLRKRDRLPAAGRVPSNNGYDIHCSERIAYQTNVSLKRLRHNVVVRDDINRAMRADPVKPDIIVADLPTLELAELATSIGREWGIPVIVSVRDLWPDVFRSLFPKALNFVASLVLWKWDRRARTALKQADSIVGISKGYLDWGLNKAKRHRRPCDAIIPLGYPDAQKLSGTAQAQSWESLVLKGVSGCAKLICFVGTFGRSYDLQTVIDSARDLVHRADIQFVLCGDGERGEEWRRQAAGLPNVLFIGWIDKKEIATLMSKATLGLAAYAPGAMQGLPNKFFEYMSFGVPILSSLGAEARDEIEMNGLGLAYEAGNPKSMTQAIIDVIDNDDSLATMAKNAVRRFDLHYRQERVCAQYAALVEKLGYR